MKELQNFITINHVLIQKINSAFIDEELTPILLTINKTEYIIQVLDEYNDLKFNNALLNFIVVFRELELMDDAVDYLDWCKQQGLRANNNKLRNYYMDCVKIVLEISAYFPNKKITSFILDLDFQLNSGEIQDLRK